MTDQELQKLRYPIGRYSRPESITDALLRQWIDTIEAFPQNLKNEVAGLTDDQLDTPYRPGGWTIRQVVHHCADSHLNAMARLKLALTEDKPTIKPYLEARWAELADSALPVASSLQLLEGLHTRWTFLLQSLSAEDLKKTFVHPEHGREMPVGELVALYGWHCAHHLAHVTGLKREKGWE